MTLRQTRSLHLERWFDCTPDELWEAWTTAEELARWFNPAPGQDAEVLELDCRPGGRLAFTMLCPAGLRIVEECFFEVVNRPRELVIYQPHEDPAHPLAGHPLTLRVLFRPEGDGTRMVFELSGFPKDIPMDGTKAGFGAAFEKLAQVTA